MNAVTIENKPDFISRAQFRGLENCGYKIFKTDQPFELEAKVFEIEEIRDNFGVAASVSPNGEWTYERGKHVKWEPQTYFIHFQNGSRIEEEPQDWAVAHWYHKYVEFDPRVTNLSLGYDGDWNFIGFIPPNILVFKYNTDWINS